MDSRSGGKIVTKRLRKHTTTPYDRPPASPKPPPKSPNWLTGVVFPATQKIAWGAAKILSSVFDSDSSSSSSSESGPGSEDDVDNNNNYDNPDNTFCSNKDNGTPSEAMKNAGKEPQLNETKHAIEQLLMRGRFSKEECDRFTQIIRSRVVDSSGRGGEDGVLTETPDGNVGNDIDDLQSIAVMEARKWLEEKKIGASPGPEMADVSHGLNSLAAQRIDNEFGSPADVAKSYMKFRPPWASPSTEPIELRTPSTMTKLFSEGTLGGESLSSYKKRNSLASGSWNIQDEIRRVRLKATEDMLHSLPSTKIDLSPFALSPKHSQDSLIANSSMTSTRYERNGLNSLTEIKPPDASVDVAAMGSANREISALDTIRNEIENESLISIPANLISEQYQDSLAIKTGSECAASKSSLSASPDFQVELCDDSRASHLNDSSATYLYDSLVEEIRSDGIQNVNGIPTSEASLSAEVGSEEIHRQQQEQNMNAVKGDEKTANIVLLEDKCELLSEASIEVPIVEADSFASFPQSSSSMRKEEFSWVLTQPNSSKLGGKKSSPRADGMSVKQEAKKTSRYNRRARGRGK